MTLITPWIDKEFGPLRTNHSGFFNLILHLHDLFSQAASSLIPVPQYTENCQLRYGFVADVCHVLLTRNAGIQYVWPESCLNKVMHMAFFLSSPLIPQFSLLRRPLHSTSYPTLPLCTISFIGNPKLFGQLSGLMVFSFSQRVMPMLKSIFTLYGTRSF